MVNSKWYTGTTSNMRLTPLHQISLFFFLIDFLGGFLHIFLATKLISLSLSLSLSLAHFSDKETFRISKPLSSMSQFLENFLIAFRFRWGKREKFSEVNIQRVLQKKSTDHSTWSKPSQSFQEFLNFIFFFNYWFVWFQRKCRKL